MTDYRVIFDDPDNPGEPTQILIPDPEWMEIAMSGGLPPIWVYWQLQDDEEKARAEGRHSSFYHDPERFALQHTAPRIGPLTEEEAIEYLIMKDIPRHVWAKDHNRPMFRIVKKDAIPTDRTFRSAWEMTA